MVAKNIGEKTAPKIAQLLKAPSSAFFIEMKAAAACITGEVLVKCCYSLEGNLVDAGTQDLIFGAFRHIERVRIHFEPEQMYGGNAEIDEIAERAAAYFNIPEADGLIKEAEADLRICQGNCDDAEASVASAEQAVLSGMQAADAPRPAQRQRRAAAEDSYVGQRHQSRADERQNENKNLLAAAAQEQMRKDNVDAAKEKVRKRLLELQRRAPPKDKEGWTDIARAVCAPAKAYHQSVFGKPSGDIDGCHS